MPNNHIGVAVPTVLLPKASIDPATWAVIACDQFTSEPEYWEQVEAIVGAAPSTFRIILPELHLNAPDVQARIAACQSAMTQYLAGGVLEPHDAFVYVERGVGSGTQHGLVVALDLETYDFNVGSQTLVRATEGTVLDRLPPRMKVRRGAELESPHILVLYDDPDGAVLAPVRQNLDALPVAYDFETMLGSGHLTGRLIEDPAIQDAISSALAGLVAPEAYRAKYNLQADAPLLFAMGDGNHSLATAKAIWTELKDAGAPLDHPARFALVELVNLHDDSLVFEPIHRVIFECGDLVSQLKAAFPGATYTPASSITELDALVRADVAPHQRFGIVGPDGYTLAELSTPRHELAVGSLQEFLDAHLAAHPAAEIDYVHGEEPVDRLARQEGNCGFILPAIGKGTFFKSIAVDGSFPRKTFSMGHAKDKRFYLECRRISS
ncbi:MAG TPA: DUF1015 domain-containing protein [Propionibacteriaceae bacterium]|nr:DUF1015 domain-containing protein [Propionibacteriaceae bacterium]HBY22111.1 DUF1015 domain-containing protein [Propionibacteriaceae bacterium]